MKIYSYIAAVIIATASFSVVAATSSVTPVDVAEAHNLQSLGVVSVSGIAGSPDDALHALKEKAMADGASHYRVIGLDTPGDSSLWRGNAEIYR